MRPPLRTTHTLVELQLSRAAYAEIAEKLRAAGYDHAFLEEGVIAMQGIGIVTDPAPPALSSQTAYSALRHVELGMARLGIAGSTALAQPSEPGALFIVFTRADGVQKGVECGASMSANRPEERLAEIICGQLQRFYELYDAGSFAEAGLPTGLIITRQESDK